MVYWEPRYQTCMSDNYKDNSLLSMLCYQKLFIPLLQEVWSITQIHVFYFQCLETTLLSTSYLELRQVLLLILMFVIQQTRRNIQEVSKPEVLEGTLWLNSEAELKKEVLVWFTFKSSRS